MAEPSASIDSPLTAPAGSALATERHRGARVAKGLAILGVAPLFLLPLFDSLEQPSLEIAAGALTLAAPAAAALAWRARGDFAAQPGRFRSVADADLGYRVGFAVTALWIMVLVGVFFLRSQKASDETVRGEAERDRGQAAMCSEAVANVGQIALAPSAGVSFGQKATELSAHANRLAEARAECERAGRNDDARKLDDEERRVRAQVTRLQGAIDERE